MKIEYGIFHFHELQVNNKLLTNYELLGLIIIIEMRGRRTMTWQQRES